MCLRNASESVSQNEFSAIGDGEHGHRGRISCLGTFFEKLAGSEVAEELRSLGKVAWPLVLTSLLLYSRPIISTLFMGHLGDTELAAGSLSIGFANITGLSVMKGLAMGMKPICYQAYGAKKWAVLSQLYKKTLFLLLLAAVPMSLLWLNTEPMLTWLGQDENIISVAKVYTRYSVLELLAQAHLHPLRTFLRTQSLTKPLTISTIFAMVLHLPITYFLVIYLNMGVRGVALASAWNTVNLNLGLLVYLFLSRTALKPWDGDTVNACSEGWQPLLSIAVPSLFCVCLEWWWYEIMILLCGLLSNAKVNLAAMGVLLQTTGLLYVFPYSLSLGLATRIGHELGDGKPAQAQRTAIVGVIVAVATGLLGFIFTVAVRNFWGKLYTTDPQILALVSRVLPLVGFCELGNSPQTAACGSGILIGSARPKIGACINFGSCYLIGLPVAVLMAFKFNMGFVGLWFGLAAAQASCVCMMVFTLVRTNWDHQANKYCFEILHLLMKRF